MPREPLDADDKLRLRNTEHTGQRTVVVDAEIDEFGPLFEKTPCHRELLDASTSARVAIVDSAIMSENE